MDGGLAGLREVEADIEIQRENYSSANEAFNRVQADFYQIGSDISHAEQQIKHTRERIETLKTEGEKARQAERELQRQTGGRQQGTECGYGKYALAGAGS